ncbi:MAG: hypothetical protein Q9212_000828 [Teloschistes hypoglaucus]
MPMRAMKKTMIFLDRRSANDLELRHGRIPSIPAPSHTGQDIISRQGSRSDRSADWRGKKDAKLMCMRKWLEGLEPYRPSAYHYHYAGLASTAGIVDID